MSASLDFKTLKFDWDTNTLRSVNIPMSTSGYGLNLFKKETEIYWRFGMDGGNNNNLNLVTNGTSGAGYYAIGINSGWVWQSDENVKNNISMVGPSLDKLLKVNPVYFKYKNYDESNNEVDNSSNPFATGFIAQNIESLFDNCVSETIYRDRTTKLLSYTSIIPYIVKSIQEQNEIVVYQQTQITELKTIVESQQTQIDELKLLVQSLLSK